MARSDTKFAINRHAQRSCPELRHLLLCATLLGGSVACTPERPLAVPQPDDASSSNVAGVVEPGLNSFSSRITLYGSPWTDDAASPDTQSFDVAVTTAGEDQFTVDLRDWSPAIGNRRRTAPIAVTFGRQASVVHHLPDGRAVQVSLTDTTNRRHRPLPSSVLQRLGRAALPQRAGAAPTHRDGFELQAPTPKVITQEVAAQTLRDLRASWPDERRLSASHIQFSAQRGGRSHRLVFDETIGAEIESESIDPAGATVLMLSRYANRGSHYALIEREQIIRSPKQDYRFVETFKSAAASGGAK